MDQAGHRAVGEKWSYTGCLLELERTGMLMTYRNSVRGGRESRRVLDFWTEQLVNGVTTSYDG